jgi:hypothetical protein
MPQRSEPVHAVHPQVITLTVPNHGVRIRIHPRREQHVRAGGATQDPEHGLITRLQDFRRATRVL